MNKKLTNEDVLKYRPMIELFLNKKIISTWSRDLSRGDRSAGAGNIGWTVEDFRQELYKEVCVALTKYDNVYKTKESTFVYLHLNNKISTLLKKLTRVKRGYGFFHQEICKSENLIWGNTL